MYRMHRIFFATPWELEAERMRFHNVLGAFNETSAMPQGILFIPVTLLNVRDKRPTQYEVNDNIRHCRHYILALSEDWGPVERNFKNDYHLALQCAADPALPMQSVAILAKRQASGDPLAPNIPAPAATFSTPNEFDACLNQLLSAYLASLASKGAAAQ
jgi:hypothetical protein